MTKIKQNPPKIDVEITNDFANEDDWLSVWISVKVASDSKVEASEIGLKF